jgi:hypothetical protein
MLKFPKIIYFIQDGVPTDAETKDAYRYGGGVVFRNARFVPAAGCLEKCEGVAGSVPDRYAAAFPVAQEALAAYIESLNIGETELAKPPVGKQSEKTPEPKPKDKTPETKADVKWKPNS